jgi:hypothetical protein
VSLPIETAEGTIQMALPDVLNKSFKDMMDRVTGNPLVMLAPSLAEKLITASERRFLNNSTTLRNHIMKIINDRKIGKN